MPQVGSGSISLVDLNDVKAATVAPSSPYEGMLWFNSSDKQLYIYKDGSWAVSTAGLKIGGKNMLSNSNTVLENSSYGMGYYVLAEKPSEGDLVTVSIKGQLGSDRAYFGLYNSGGNVFVASITPNDKDIDGVYKKTFNWRIVAGANTASNTALYIYQMFSNNTSTSKIEWIKMERGNVSTTWSPAPEDAEKKITDLSDLIGNMSDDNLLDLKDRQQIKDQLFQITGIVIADTALMASTTTLDSGLKGSFYKTRKAAFNAGVLVTHATYIALATQYNNLKTYLESITSPRAWDTSTGNRNYAINVNKATFRDKWMQYFLAEQALEVLTADQLKKNVDNIIVGSRNWVRNSTFNYVLGETTTLTDWESIDPAFTVKDAEADKPTSRILNITRSGLSADAIVSAYSNRFPARIGDVFTISMDIKTADPAAWTNQTAFIFEGWNAANSRIQQTGSTVAQAGVSSLVANVWYRLKFTVTVTTDLAIAKLRLISYRNGNVSYREIQVEKGNQMTDYKPAPEDNENQIYILEEKYNNAMENLTDEKITSTVMGSTFYTEAMAELATQEQLGEYAKTDDLDTAKTDLQGEITDKISEIDFTPYVVSSDLEQTEAALTAKFSSGGGINLVSNSVGYNGTVGWTPVGTVGTVKDSALNQYGYDSGFASTLGVAGSIYQMPYTTVGQSYTITFMVRKEAESSSTASAAQVVILDSSDTAIAYLGKLSGSGISNEYTKVVYTFVATSSKTKIKIDFEQNCKATISGLMLNIGLVPLQWSMAPGELYNTNIKMDKNGITVNQISGEKEVGRTVMTPTKFAGYYDVDNSGAIDDTNGSPDEVFRLDKDEFVMKKATVRNEITMGTLKIVNVENPTGFTGWAFTGNKSLQ